MSIAPTKNGRDWLDAYKKRIIISIVSILTVTITVTLFLMACTLRDRLLRESRLRAEELGTVLHSSLSHLMVARNPGKIQQTLTEIERENPSLVRTMIIDDRGKVVYSTRAADIGTILDRFREPTCRGCHSGPVAVPREKTTTLQVDGVPVQRYVHIIPNAPACHRCHRSAQRINGKLIIDRSLVPTNELIATIVLLVSGLGVVSLAFLIPFLWRYLSRGVDTYINEVRLKSTELLVLYGIVERLSATIELEQLKRVIIEIVSNAFAADEIDVVIPSEYRELGAIIWTKAGSTLERRKVEAGSFLQETVHRWMEGGVPDHGLADNDRAILMPISKGGNRLALIVVRRSTGTYEPTRLALVRAMANHIAIAFDNAMLYHMAITDELTGLFSSRHFRQAIEKKHDLYRDYGEKMTLLMVDIDNFKRINDNYGHPAGDAILRQMGKCILSSIRDDDMAFRYGGEEFAVILPASDLPAGKAVAERMRALVEHYPFRADQHVLNVTVSIGMAAWPASAETIKELIGAADKALYEAKHTGKNRVAVQEGRSV